LKLDQLKVTTIMELKRILHDRRRLAVLVLGPVILCLIFGYSAYTNPQNINVAVLVDSFTNPTGIEYPETRKIIETIDSTQTFTVIEVYSLKDAMERLEKGYVRGIIVFEEGPTDLEIVEVTVDVTDSTIQQAVTGQLKAILSQESSLQTVQYSGARKTGDTQSAMTITPFTMDISTNQNRDLTQFDLGSSGIIILFAVGVSLFMASIAVTSERSLGTIERIFASPFKLAVIIISKILANSLFAIVVAGVIWLTLKIAFDVTMGNMALTLLLTVVASINAIILGLLVSSVTYTELESILGGVMCWFMAMFLMGLSWPLETMHPIFTYFSKLIPFTYALHSIRNVNLVGWGFIEILPDLLISFGFMVVLTIGAIFMLRREIR
jgi:ABC-2 type transport system permease protein